MEAIRSWVLIGMMGSGKSALGRELASITEREFIDCDRLLQNRVCHSIPNFFKLYGESAFRTHETCVLRDLEPGSTIVSTGGGVVLRPENWTEMRRLGIVTYLRCDPERLIERLKVSRKKRPLLAGDDWEEKLRDIYDQRRYLYEQADVIYDVIDQDLPTAAVELRAILEEGP